MKKTIISLVALFGLVTGPLYAVNPLPPDTKFQGTGNVVPAGSTLTIGGTFTAASGSTINLGAGTVTAGSTTVGTGKSLTMSAGSTLTLSGAIAGTPTTSTVVWGNVTFTSIGTATILTGKTWTFNSGSSLAINGALSGLPTTSTLDFTNVTFSGFGTTTLVTGKTFTANAGSTIAISGTFGGTPSGGTLDLSAVTVTNGKNAIGASTAAAGSTTSDAGVLPAATARVYPTTAADDATGVRVHANDKVTGRMLFIGNGVSNKVLKVYAPSGGTINGAAGDAAFSSVSGKGVIIICLDSTGNTWLAW